MNKCDIAISDHINVISEKIAKDLFPSNYYILIGKEHYLRTFTSCIYNNLPFKLIMILNHMINLLHQRV